MRSYRRSNFVHHGITKHLRCRLFLIGPQRCSQLPSTSLHCSCVRALNLKQSLPSVSERASEQGSFASKGLALDPSRSGSDCVNISQKATGARVLTCLSAYFTSIHDEVKHQKSCRSPTGQWPDLRSPKAFENQPQTLGRIVCFQD